MKVRLVRTWEQLRSSFWFTPILMALGAVLLAGVMLYIDTKQQSAPLPMLKWFYLSGPSGARALLSTIAASAITVTSIIFSLTVVTLSMASNQFGPRLLPNFMQHGGTQIAQGTFIATFIYTLLILSRIPDSEANGFPHLSVITGLVLGIISFFVLIYFVHHVSRFIRVSRVLDDVANNLRSHMQTIFPESIGTGGEPKPQENARPMESDKAAQIVTGKQNGYLQAIDTEALMELAQRHDIVIRLRVRPGHFIVSSHPVAEVTPAGSEAGEKIAHRLNDLLILGPERTSTQDVEFAVGQLVEVGLRALSAGINDPFTAINCIDRIGSILSFLAQRQLPEARRYDREGKLRVIAKPYTYGGIINTAFDQLRQAAQGEVSVSLRLLETIRMLAERRLPNEYREALAVQAHGIYHANKDTFQFEKDRADLQKRYRAVEDLLRSNETMPPMK